MRGWREGREGRENRKGEWEEEGWYGGELVMGIPCIAVCQFESSVAVELSMDLRVRRIS